MVEEFRFVIDNPPILEKFNLDRSRARDFTDYYVARNKRVRYSFKTKTESESFDLITSEPGALIKKKRALTKKQALELIRVAGLVIQKKGLGHIRALDVEGYAENIKFYEGNSTQPFREETQIEFEENPKIIPALIKELKPTKIIKTGLFDYALS